MIKTASFFTYPNSGVGRIVISRSAPRGYPAGYKIYKPLAPGPWFNSVTYKEYRRRYFSQLAKLNPQGVVDALYSLTETPVLLCYERPPFDTVNYCHRRMVAEWLENELGINVPEYHAKCGAEGRNRTHVLSLEG